MEVTKTSAVAATPCDVAYYYFTKLVTHEKATKSIHSPIVTFHIFTLYITFICFLSWSGMILTDIQTAQAHELEQSDNVVINHLYKMCGKNRLRGLTDNYCCSNKIFNLKMWFSNMHLMIKSV